MIVEERIYTLHHGKVPEYLQLYAEEGRSPQMELLGCNVGYYSTDIGPQNVVVHLWAYADLAQRELRRAALAADPRWQAYVPKIRPLMLVQETRILKPASFFAQWVQVQLENSHAA